MGTVGTAVGSRVPVQPGSVRTASPHDAYCPAAALSAASCASRALSSAAGPSAVGKTGEGAAAGAAAGAAWLGLGLE